MNDCNNRIHKIASWSKLGLFVNKRTKTLLLVPVLTFQNSNTHAVCFTVLFSFLESSSLSRSSLSKLANLLDVLATILSVSARKSCYVNSCMYVAIFTYCRRQKVTPHRNCCAKCIFIDNILLKIIHIFKIYYFNNFTPKFPCCPNALSFY